ncbi:MAG: hypothetical protein D8M59_11585 [Planctomycetes bacterium]|nr:hypothetical protein [Planctomycetota bacterium]NOG55403.1 S8 family serine peptidase [Planctomycetota bacterium]
MQFLTRSLAATGILALTIPLAAQELNVPYAPTILQPDLLEILAQTEGNELIPITIVMQDQVDRTVIEDASRIADKKFRRETVTALLKEMASATQGEILALLHTAEANGQAEYVRPLWLHNVIGVKTTADVIDALALRPDIAWINYDQPVFFEDVFPVEPQEPDKAGDDHGGALAEIECGVDLMDADRVWNELGITGNGVVVGVIDTGCCLSHSDIQNQIWTNPGETLNGIDDDGNGFIDDINGWNFENNNNNVTDLHGHGSHVSGTVAGDGTGGTECGMAPNAQIMTCKFWNSFSGEQTVWDGMQYGVDNGADILTASLGWPNSMNPDRYTWRTLSENAMAAGVVVMFAAHNYGCGNPPWDVTTPGDVPDMITVGAVDCNDNKASFSSCGPVTWENEAPWFDWAYPPGKMKPTISAPGVNTKSHNRCSGYTNMSGTSMATPHVAGAAALILEANPNLDHFDVKDILSTTAVDLGTPGMDNQTGWGRVDAYQAVLAAMSGPQPLVLQPPANPQSGQMNDFTVSKCNPGYPVALVYSLRTGSTKWPACPGVSINLDSPKVAATAVSNRSGIAVISVSVPKAASGVTSYQQAAEPSTCNTSQVVKVFWN